MENGEPSFVWIEYIHVYYHNVLSIGITFCRCQYDTIGKCPMNILNMLLYYIN